MSHTKGEPCPVKGCRLKLRQFPLCSWHWLQTPVRIRNQVTRGMIPVSFASVMSVNLEAQHERQEKIDEAGER